MTEKARRVIDSSVPQAHKSGAIASALSLAASGKIMRMRFGTVRR